LRNSPLSLFQIAKIYNKVKMEKGLAFPTCISVNSCVGHFSPLPEAEDVLKEGDLAKIDLAVHVDGYIASVAQTIVVTAEGKPATGKVADLLTATYQASEIGLPPSPFFFPPFFCELSYFFFFFFFSRGFR